jgi:hypothetical protein
MSLKHRIFDELHTLERDLIALLPGEHHAAVRSAVENAAVRSGAHIDHVEANPNAAGVVPVVAELDNAAQPTEPTEPTDPTPSVDPNGRDHTASTAPLQPANVTGESTD